MNNQFIEYIRNDLKHIRFINSLLILICFIIIYSDSILEEKINKIHRELKWIEQHLNDYNNKDMPYKYKKIIINNLTDEYKALQSNINLKSNSKIIINPNHELIYKIEKKPILNKYMRLSEIKNSFENNFWHVKYVKDINILDIESFELWIKKAESREKINKVVLNISFKDSLDYLYDSIITTKTMAYLEIIDKNEEMAIQYKLLNIKVEISDKKSF